MLTPAQARDLVDHFGSQRAAATAVDVAESTLRYWLDPELGRARSRKAYSLDPEPKLALQRERYRDLSGYEYNRLLLLRRRTKALRRLDQRRGLDGAPSPQE